MAKRKREVLKDGEKRRLNKTNLRKILSIFRFAFPHKWAFTVGLIALILSSATLLSFPYFAGKLLDLASGKPIPFFSSINEVAFVLITILVIQSLFSFLRVYTFSIVSEKTLADIRKMVYKKMIWLPMTFFDSRRVGELLSRISTDAGTLQEMFTTTLAEFFRQLLTLILGTVIIFYLAPQLTVFMLLTFPVLIVLALLFGKFIRKLSRHTQDKLAEANVIADESLHSITVVKAFTNEMLEISRYTKSLKEAVMVAIRSSRYRGLFISFVILTIFGGIVGILWYGASLVQSHAITTGTLFSFVLYTSFIAGSMAGMGDLYSQVQRSVGASERILEILREEDEFPLATGDAIKLSGKVRFDGVSFAYPTRPEVTVLQRLNFEIFPGEKVALVGPSGSGKSTIINLLMRFYSPETGSILADDRNILEYPLTSYRHNLGVVPQEVILFGGSIGENISYGKPQASMVEIRAAAEKANALEFIESFPRQFDTLVGERGVKLSGGQRQRIAIARAILKDPSVLILDEATSSLDAYSEALVQEALEKLMEGRTTIIIAHRLSTIKKVDRIFVINEGRLVETGSHAELVSLNNGIYSKLLKLQLQ